MGRHQAPGPRVGNDMNAVTRTFEDAPATREGHSVPLIVGITSPSGGGKTFSALRLATGIQRVMGGDIYGIDTESERMLHYADYFKFRHVPFNPPHGPLDYKAAIDHCVKRGARIIIADQMSYEHDGDGGVLDQMEAYLEQKAGEDWAKRDKLKFTAQIEPKRQRKELNRRIIQLGNVVTFILLYRAEEKIKPKAGGKPEELGWTPITTSKLPYDMTVRFLLPPGSNGVPTLMPSNPAEKLLTKNPKQFEGWFREGEPLSEEMGQRLAEWARGGTGANEFDTLIAEYAKCADKATFEKLKERRDKLWQTQSPHKPRLKEASDAAARRLKEAAKVTPDPKDEPLDNAGWIKELSEQVTSAALTVVWQKCTDVFGVLVPPDIYDAYEEVRDRLIEREAQQQF